MELVLHRGGRQVFEVNDALVLKLSLHYYKAQDQGRSQLGGIDNDTYGAGVCATAYGQTWTLGLQKVDARTPFDYITQNDRIFLYLSNSQQFIATYTRGEADLTRVGPNSVGYGYIYNPDGKYAKHWEWDFVVKYQVPSLRWAAHREV